MDMRKYISLGIVLLFIGLGWWYYGSGLRDRQDGPAVLVPPSSDTTTIQLPTSTPHVNGPTAPPPSKTTPPKPVVITSGIRGSVFIGPTCPVVRNPPDPQCADRPYEATLVAKDKDGVIVKTFRSNSAGLFEVLLLPGEYSVGPAPSTAILPRAGFQDVSVQKDAFTEITIQFDSGIR